MKLKNHEMNLCEGAILPKLLLYALPLIATNILQILFNAADVAVLGIFLGDAGDAAVAAVRRQLCKQRRMEHVRRGQFAERSGEEREAAEIGGADARHGAKCPDRR